MLCELHLQKAVEKHQNKQTKKEYIRQNKEYRKRGDRCMSPEQD